MERCTVCSGNCDHLHWSFSFIHTITVPGYDKREELAFFATTNKQKRTNGAGSGCDTGIAGYPAMIRGGRPNYGFFFEQ